MAIIVLDEERIIKPAISEVPTASTALDADLS
jgi:hypothetical protein